MKIIWLATGARTSEEGHCKQGGKRRGGPETSGSRPHVAMLALKWGFGKREGPVWPY